MILPYRKKVLFFENGFGHSCLLSSIRKDERMEICACRECRRLFNYLSGAQICPDCRQAMEDKYLEVKNYLTENPNAGMTQILKSCDVKSSYITHWVNEGRLELNEYSGSGIRCEGCGAIVQSGRFCNKCKINFLHEWSMQEYKEREEREEEPVEEKEEHNSPRMWYTRHLH